MYLEIHNIIELAVQKIGKLVTMRRDMFAGLVFCEAAFAVRLENIDFPMLKYCNEEFVEAQLVPMLG